MLSAEGLCPTHPSAFSASPLSLIPELSSSKNIADTSSSFLHIHNKRAAHLDDLPLSADELSCCKRFEALLQNTHGVEVTSPILCAQFVLGSKCRLDKAERQYLRFQAFARDLRLDEVSNEDILRCARKVEEFVEIGGVDSEQRLCFGILRRKLVKNDPLTEGRKLVKTLLTLMAALSTNLDFCRHGATFVTDCSGMGMQNFTVELNQLLIRVMEEACPIRIGRVLLLESPYLLRGFLALLKPFLSEKMNSRIVVAPRNQRFGPDLADEEVSPPSVGGKGPSISVYDVIEEYLSDGVLVLF